MTNNKSVIVKCCFVSMYKPLRSRSFGYSQASGGFALGHPA
jgi:hypothetical protein